MTGLQQFIEWLDKGNEIINLLVEKDKREWVDKKEVLQKARALFAEEQSHAIEVKEQGESMPFREYFKSLPKEEREAASVQAMNNIKAFAESLECPHWDGEVCNKPAPVASGLVEELEELCREDSNRPDMELLRSEVRDILSRHAAPTTERDKGEGK